MKREIKFRQRILRADGSFSKFAYWGFIDNEFRGPAHQGGHPSTAKDSDQFTGLLDKNGKEIYEGDLINMFYDEPMPRPHVVWFFGPNCSFVATHIREYLEYRDNRSSPIWIANTGKVPNSYGAKVIGNIYEHEYLLK